MARAQRWAKGVDVIKYGYGDQETWGPIQSNDDPRMDDPDLDEILDGECYQCHLPRVACKKCENNPNFDPEDFLP